jgi:hypothetical protein
LRASCPYYADDSELTLLESILTVVYIDSPIVKEFAGRYGGCFSTVEVLLFTPSPLQEDERLWRSINYSELGLRGCLHSFSNETTAVALTGHMN